MPLKKHLTLLETEISVLAKAFSFVPTPEKISHWLIKRYLEKNGRSLQLKMDCVEELAKAFSASIYKDTFDT